MKVTILGAGAGGLSAAVELGLNKHSTRLWSRSESTLRPLRDAGAIKYKGVFGSGEMAPAMISTDLGMTIDGTEAILVCLPTLAHAETAKLLATLGATNIPIVLNPGHTGGALEFCEVFRRFKLPLPPIAELSTLTYVARKSAPDTVWTTGAARQVRVAALPGGTAALAAARGLYACATPTPDVLATGLANVNMVLHPPGAILGASWVESTRGEFTFYVQGLTDGVGRVMEALDVERRAVATSFGHDLPSLFEEMQGIGTIEADADPRAGLATAVRGGIANRHIKAPDSLAHRYYREDFCYGLQPFLAFANIAEVHVPVARSLMRLQEKLVGPESNIEGRSAAAMGIQGLSRIELMEIVCGRV